MMNQQTLYIAFGGSQVAVHSNVPEALVELKRRFFLMIEQEPTNVVGQMEVRRNGRTYLLLIDSEINIVDNSLSNILGQLSYETTLHLMQAHANLLWLHAGATACRGRAVVLSGAWGRGKSTIVTNLCARGWIYLSDDIVPLNPNSSRVFPFPRMPMVRKNPGHEIPRHRLPAVRKSVIDLKPERVCREAIPVSALVFPTYSFHTLAELLPYSPATATVALLQNCINFMDHRGEAVRYISGLVTRLPVFHLPFSDGKLAAELIAQAHENW